MYYLLHHFNPDFNHTALKPCQGADGRADLRNMGYVQNVRRGELLAQLLCLEGASREILEQARQRAEFVCKEPHLPAGSHTVMEERQGVPVLLAAQDGYVFYENGKISVKSLLNVRGNVDFHTGNINFVGDVHVHGNVATGFVVRGRNLLLDGGVEGSIVLARGDLTISHGARGASRSPCFLQARGAITLGFADKIELSSGTNTQIQKSALHSHLFVGRRLGLFGLLSGGSCQVRHSMAVKGDVGTMGGTIARITLGYDPLIIRAVNNAHKRLEEVCKELSLLQPHLEDPFSLPVPDLKLDLNEKAREQDGLFRYKVKKLRLWAHVLEKQLNYLKKECEASRLERSPGLYVTGTMHAGTEINICGALMVLRESLHGVRLEKEGERIVVLPLGKALEQEKGMAGLV